MTPKSISRFAATLLALALAGWFLDPTGAGAGWRDIRLLDQTGSCLNCPACDHVCRFKAEQIEQEMTCFDVETKVICIPRVVFPWQQKKHAGRCDSCDGIGCNDCIHNGAKTRKVCVLKTDSYKCPKCQYSWSAERKPCPTACDAPCDADRLELSGFPFEVPTPMIEQDDLPPQRIRGEADGTPDTQVPAPTQ